MLWEGKTVANFLGLHSCVAPKFRQKQPKPHSCARGSLGRNRVCTLWGVRSVAMFHFVFFRKLRLPIGLHNSCSMSQMAGEPCQKMRLRGRPTVKPPSTRPLLFILVLYGARASSLPAPPMLYILHHRKAVGLEIE